MQPMPTLLAVTEYPWNGFAARSNVRMSRREKGPGKVYYALLGRDSVNQELQIELTHRQLLNAVVYGYVRVVD